MKNTKDTVIDYFLKCFSSIKFAVIQDNVIVPKKQEPIEKDSIIYLKKMIMSAKKDLNKAIKSNKAGKLPIEDVYDCQIHVFELTEELKKVMEIDESENIDDELIWKR